MRISALILALTTSLAARAEPVPPAAQPSPQPAESGSAAPTIALVAVGTTALVVSYGGSVATAALYGVLVVPFLAAFKARIPTDPLLLFVPVFGPLQIIHNDNLDHGTKELMYLDAAVQAAGIALVAVGFAVRPSNRPSLQPFILPGGAGLGGRF